MLSDTIKEISTNFIKEALSSPHLLSDMAAMEKYMAESYNGRTFIELLQNADDCNSKRVFVSSFENDIIFANDGKPFDKNDILSISRSGASNKKRGENIGYRGIGFKSTISLTDEIIIFTDNTYFTFSKKTCAEKLNLAINDIPTIRIPLLTEKPNDTLHKLITDLKEQNYTTIFIFKNAKVNTFLEELQTVNESDFIFLNNIEKCKIKFDKLNLDIELCRTKRENTQLLTFRTNNNKSWLIWKNNGISLGLKYDLETQKVIPCTEQEQVYHSYLPTFDKICFPLKINADFSTDPSRKHIVIDKNTTDALENASIVISDIINLALNSKLSNEFSNIFNILNSSNNFSRCNNVLKQQIQKNITGKVKATSNYGKMINISEYKLLPNWLEDSEKFYIRIHSDVIRNLSYNVTVYKTFDKVDEFISNYSSCQFTIENVIEFMKEKPLIQKMSPHTQGKIISKIIKAEFLAEKIHDIEIDLSEVNILTNIGIKTIKEVSVNELYIESTVQTTINNNLSSSDWDWFNKKYQIGINNIKSDNLENTGILKSSEFVDTGIKPHISKWRSAEQQCMEIEKFFGNRVSDVSKRNIGYDIESITPAGCIRRIEVKSIADKSGFSITNNEYTAAHQYSDEYFLCLIYQNDNKIKLTYIQNPLRSIKFEKRIRQWEWFCEEYYGESYTFNL